MNKTIQPEKISEMERAETIAAKLVIWWQLGMPAVASEFLNYNNRGKIQTSGKAWYVEEIVNDGRIALLSMAGPAATHLGRYEDGHLWCILKHIDTHAELANPTKYGWHSTCDFDWVICSGLKISGRIDEVRDCVRDIDQVSSLSYEEFRIVQWTCRAYYLLAYIILTANWEKFIATTELISQKGTLFVKEVMTLFKNWGIPKILDFSMKRIENLIGKCPMEIDTNTFDLIIYGISELKRNESEKSTSSNTTKEKQ